MQCQAGIQTLISQVGGKCVVTEPPWPSLALKSLQLLLTKLNIKAYSLCFYLSSIKSLIEEKVWHLKGLMNAEKKHLLVFCYQCFQFSFDK